MAFSYAVALSELPKAYVDAESHSIEGLMGWQRAVSKTHQVIHGILMFTIMSLYKYRGVNNI